MRAAAIAGRGQRGRQLGVHGLRVGVEGPAQRFDPCVHAAQSHRAARQRGIAQADTAVFELELTQRDAPRRCWRLVGIGARRGGSLRLDEPGGKIQLAGFVARQFDGGLLQAHRSQAQAVLQQVGAHIGQGQALPLQQHPRRGRLGSPGGCGRVGELEFIDSQAGQRQRQTRCGTARPVQFGRCVQLGTGLRAQHGAQVGLGRGQVQVFELQCDLRLLVGHAALGLQLTRGLAGGAQLGLDAQRRVALDRPAQLLQAQLDTL